MSETLETPETENNAQCSKNVYILSGRQKGLWGGDRGVHGFRCDDNVFSAFKQRVRAVGTSICSVVETLLIAYLGATDHMLENNVNIGATFNLNQTVYRNLGRDRRRVNPQVVTERDVNDNEIGDLESVAGPFITYYLDRPSLDPNARTLYGNFKMEGLELDWEVKQDLASLILRRLKEARG